MLIKNHKKIILGYCYSLLKELVISFVFYSSLSLAQDNSNIIKIGGSINLSDNFYTTNRTDKRQPSNVAQGIFRTTITIYDQIQLPFELYLSSRERRFQQPFNQFGVSPRISNWLTLHAGYYSSNISDFTFGDLRLLGGGVELTPGNFRFKVLYGRSQAATEFRDYQYQSSVYKQNAYAVSIGYGNESVAYFDINLFHAIDDSNSIKRDSLTNNPAENLVGSLKFGAQIIDGLSFQSEVAVSAYSSNILSDRLEDISTPKILFTPNVSSRIDGAAKIQFLIRPSNYWSLALNAKWIGPGFTTLGYSLMTNDLMEFSISPSVKLLDNKLYLRAQGGLRFNNLRNNRLSTTSRFTGSFNANWQISQKVGLDLNYNNNQIKSSHKNDTLKLSNVFNSIMVSPRFMFEGFGGINNISVNYTYQNSLDKNVISSQYTDNKNHCLSTIHSLSLQSLWSFTTSLVYNKNTTSNFSTEIINISENVSKRLFDNKLNITAGIGINFIKTTKKDNQLYFNLISNYNLGKYGSLGFTLSNSNYRADSEISETYHELYGGLQYNIAF